MLRSANYGELVEPRTRGKRYGPRSFRVAAAFIWNNLPRHLRNDGISREELARDLKTVLSARAYLSEAPLRTSVSNALYKWTYLHCVRGQSQTAWLAALPNTLEILTTSFSTAPASLLGPLCEKNDVIHKTGNT